VIIFYLLTLNVVTKMW